MNFYSQTLDMLEPLVTVMHEAEQGFLAYDAHMDETVFVQVAWMTWLGDNPMLEQLSMLTSPQVCRMCEVCSAFISFEMGS